MSWTKLIENAGFSTNNDTTETHLSRFFPLSLFFKREGEQKREVKIGGGDRRVYQDKLS